MNLKQARAKLDSVSKSTALKHPKVLVAELCVVVKFLLEEIDRVESSTMSVLSKRLPEDLVVDTPPPAKLPSIIPQPEKMPRFPSPNPIVLPPRKREGNAGDAK